MSFSYFSKNALRMAACVSSLVMVVLVTGCAHPITLTPDINKIGNATSKINKSAGYYISPADMAKEMETKGGGGDNVKYMPYRDLDAGMFKAFSQVFDNVVKLKSPGDAAAQGVQLVIVPSITTFSASDSLLTWPPTQFSITITNAVSDVNGKEIARVQSTGQGQATFSEFTSDFSLSAKRAAQDVMDKLVKDLASSTSLRQ